MLPRRLMLAASACGLLFSLLIASSAQAVDVLPVGPTVKVTETTSTTIKVSWTQVGGESGFVVSYSKSADFDPEATETTSIPSYAISGLTKQTSYYVRVKSVDADGNDLTAWSATIRATTGPILLRIGSYNVKDPDKVDGSCRSWTGGRKDLVAQEIVDSKADVVGIQETYEDDERSGLMRSIRAKGGTYLMTRPENEQSGWDNRLIYNSSRLTLIASKPVPFRHQDDTKSRAREYVRGTFELKANRHRFLVYSTHVEPGGSATLKAQQWDEIRANAVTNGVNKKVPVFIVGDFNTSKFRAPANIMLPKMKSSGFGDVLGQSYQSYKASGQRAKSRTNAWINSYNDCNPRYGKVSKSAIGNNIDWIFATNSLEIPSWRTVVHFKSGTTSLARTPMASDHFMVTIQARLP